MPDGPRYEDDFYAWTKYQAEILRSLQTSDNRFDREHVAEEIEDLGKSERDAARSQIRRIIEHLLKLEYSPAREPRFDWLDSIIDARQNLEDKLTPTLRRELEQTMSALYRDGLKRARAGLNRYGEGDAAAHLPALCPYSFDAVCDQDWYPPSPVIPDPPAPGRRGARRTRSRG
jgi:hypothetical protein